MNTDYVWLALGWMAFIAIIVVVVVVALVVLVRGRSNGDRAPHAHSPESRPASPAEGETKA